MYFHLSMLGRLLRLTLSPRRLHPLHALVALLFIPLFLLLRGLVVVARWMDRLLYPEYRNQPLAAPIYIVGNPRSGTTFTHRLMARDERFTYFQLYHTIFPAVSLHRLLRAIGAIDRRLGSPGYRLVQAASRKGFAGWDDIHRTGPREAESDEMLFMFALLSPLLALQFPYIDELEPAMFVDRLPEATRRKLMRTYVDSLRRQLYATGPDRILLQKVALIAGRIHSIVEAIPDIRIVHLVRHPYESVPSLISMFQAPWRAIAPQAMRDHHASRALAEVIFSYYRVLLDLKRTMPPSQFIEVRYEELVADPKATVERVYRELDLPMSNEYAAILDQERVGARAYRSKHSYSLEACGLTRDDVYCAMPEVFEAYGFAR